MTMHAATLTRLAAALGLDTVAAIRAPSQLPGGRLEQLLADGIGDMTWLTNHQPLHRAPRQILPQAESVIVALLPYSPQPACTGDYGLRRARYAQHKDYHKLLRSKLAKLGQAIDEHSGNPGHHRATADSAPVDERTLARLAGLGWIGRNGLLIRPRHGSYHFIGCLFTSVRITDGRDQHDHDRCGTCHACVDRCPTAALHGRRVLSERCISYLTIEHAGIITRDLAARFDGWWFGCDLCQEVCPWNRFAPAAGDQRLVGTDDEDELLAVRADTFDRVFAGRAIRRLGYERLRRNLVVALWSLGHHQRAATAVACDPLPLVVAQATELGLDWAPSAQ
ncbi:MAG: tRNA epoxyqueuosine(34) reductase QueG [Planctomycetota bacterium]|jgi:epoxyqueuosine reductase